MNILSLYEKLERLVQRLPERLQSPILREITPIKTLFLQQRPPRLLLLGDRTASRSGLANTLFSSPVAEAAEDFVQDGAWQVFSHGQGKIRILDARRPAAVTMVRRGLATEAPDVALFLHAEPRQPEEVEADLAHAREILQAIENRHPGSQPKIIGVGVNSLSGASPDTARRHLSDFLHTAFEDRVTGIFALQETSDRHALASAIAAALPDDAKLEMARASGVLELQREIAQILVKSVSAICGAVGTQPIPLADFPILTSLQAGMVAGIMHISGREMNAKLGGEFITALGANIGFGLALREGARAALRVIPVWGDVVAGGIAAAGTYGIGRAAIAYFIEGLPLPDVRRLFRKKKDAPLLKSRND